MTEAERAAWCAGRDAAAQECDGAVYAFELQRLEQMRTAARLCAKAIRKLQPPSDDDPTWLGYDEHEQLNGDDA